MGLYFNPSPRDFPPREIRRVGHKRVDEERVLMLCQIKESVTAR